MLHRLLFQKRENRDNAARKEIASGRKFRKGSVRGQVLSPSYVEDYEGTPTPNGFGGSASEYFGTLYTLELQS